MHLLILLTATEEASKWEIGEGHVVIILGIVSVSLGIVISYFKLKDQHKATLVSRECAVIERNEQKELLQEISKEFRPNHGSSLVDRVAVIGTAVSEHSAAAAKWFADNDQAHQEIKNLHTESNKATNDRIDGIYEIMLSGTTDTPQAKRIIREEHNES